jgi:Gpi18-like mannosyltransferase
VNIAHHGYTYIPDVAFFPFWPLLEHIGGLLLGGVFPDSYYFAGLLLSNLFFYFALVLLYRLLAEDFEESIARRALLYLAFSPYALFFFAGYTESLFLLLTLALFLVLRRGQPLDWWLAGLFGLVASATRSTGIILTIPFLVLYIKRFWLPGESTPHPWWQRINALLPIALIPLGIVAYMIFLYITKGNPLLFASQEVNFGWHRHLSLPWAGIFSDIGSLFSFHVATTIYIQNILDLIFTLIPLVALAIGWRRLPLHYTFFALGVALFTLAFPQGFEPLASLPRYMLIVFPVTALFALWGKRERFHQVVLAFSLSLLAFNIVLFILHNWVA